jgi:hypothetical protein
VNDTVVVPLFVTENVCATLFAPRPTTPKVSDEFETVICPGGVGITGTVEVAAPDPQPAETRAAERRSADNVRLGMEVEAFGISAFDKGSSPQQ